MLALQGAIGFGATITKGVESVVAPVLELLGESSVESG